MAIVPGLALGVAIAIQIGLVGASLWSAGAAARAGARAAHVGGDAVAAARSSLPTYLRRGSHVEDGDAVRVRVLVPTLLPGVPRIPLEARAGFDPDAGGP